MNYDVIIIGAGTSGMMAAISASQLGAKTLLIEKNKRIGKKLLLTGGGRCNVTNNRSPEDVIRHIPGNGRFLHSAFSQFDNHDLIAFFKQQGVQLKEEDHGRMFPISNQSKTIIETLQKRIQEEHVTLWTETVVKEVLVQEEKVVGVQLQSGKQISASTVIIATGGKTYPHTGSTGDGYQFAKKTGHTITPLYATESPLISDEFFIQQKTLQGLALQDISLSVINEKGKAVITHEMDVLFTHFGLSGPAALRCSMFVQKQIEKQKSAIVRLDALPHKKPNQLVQWVFKQKKADKNKSVKNALKGLLPERYLHFLLEKAQIDTDKPIKQLTEKEIENFVFLIKNLDIHITKTWPLDKSFVTGGGVTLKQIHPKSMESKLISGLFFTGELLDINGYTGGYNITAAFITGFVAGKHAATLAINH